MVKPTGDVYRGPDNRGQQPTSGSQSDSRKGTEKQKSGGKQGDQPNEKQAERFPETPQGDAPNLEYAQKVTELALRFLKEQEDNPDRSLLDELGWSQDDLRKFVQRWERLRGRAAQGGESGGEARRELLERLDSLGLQSPTDVLRQGLPASRDPRGGGLDAGQRTQPPREYLEQFLEYQKGIATESE